MPPVIYRGLIAFTGLLSLVQSARLWFSPNDVGASLGLATISTVGVATLRADVAAFFAVLGVMSFAAVITRDKAMLIVPAMLVGLALAGRIITFVVTEASIETLPPMVIEALLLALYAKARATFET